MGMEELSEQDLCGGRIPTEDDMLSAEIIELCDLMKGTIEDMGRSVRGLAEVSVGDAEILPDDELVESDSTRFLRSYACYRTGRVSCVGPKLEEPVSNAAMLSEAVRYLRRLVFSIKSLSDVAMAESRAKNQAPAGHCESGDPQDSSTDFSIGSGVCSFLMSSESARRRFVEETFKVFSGY